MNNTEIIKILKEGLAWANAYKEEYERGMCRNPGLIDRQIDEYKAKMNKAIKTLEGK